MTRRRIEKLTETAKIIWSLLAARAFIAGMILILVGIGCIFITYALTSSSSQDALQQALIRGDQLDATEANALLSNYAASSRFPAVVVGIGQTFVSVGLLSIAWDLWLNFAWLRLVRQEILEGLTEPDALGKVARMTRRRVLAKLLKLEHGPSLGGALFAESDMMKKGNRALREDFSYNVILSPHTSAHHAAELDLDFVVNSIAMPMKIHFSRVDDSFAFHSRYQDLVDSSPQAIYRYVLLSKDPRSEDEFRIESAEITDGGDLYQLSIKEAKTVKLGKEFILSSGTRGDRKIARAQPRRLRVKLRIQTVVDASRGEFPIWLGYPVNKFKSELMLNGVAANQVDVLAFFASNRPYRRSDPTSTQTATGAASPPSTRVAGEVDDLIFANSGLTYVWR